MKRVHHHRCTAPVPVQNPTPQEPLLLITVTAQHNYKLKWFLRPFLLLSQFQSAFIAAFVDINWFSNQKSLKKEPDQLLDHLPVPYHFCTEIVILEANIKPVQKAGITAHSPASCEERSIIFTQKLRTEQKKSKFFKT